MHGRVLIVGAGDSGNALLREIVNNGNLNHRPLGFIDDDPARWTRNQIKTTMPAGT